MQINPVPSSRIDPALSTDSYRYWESAAEVLLEPLVALMQPGQAEMPIIGPGSRHGSRADRLESFSRPCLLAAHWLAAGSAGVGRTKHGALDRDRVAAWFRQGFLCGTDPKHPAYWQPNSMQYESAVEMCVMVLAFEMARPWLWDPFTKKEKQQIARWLGSARGAVLHRNNHLFFGVFPLCFLRKEGFGQPSDRNAIFNWLDLLEGMSIGGGWFIDGKNETMDHYNAYAFHYYGLWWSLLYGAEDPVRAEKWKSWAHFFLADYAKFFSSEGEPVPFGRSLTYRFACSASFALAERCGVSPLSPGAARRLSSRCLRFFMERPILQKQGALSLGWVDEFPESVELYSCGGSPYWAAKGFAPLLLAPDSAFWTEPEKPIPSEVENGLPAVVPTAGIVVRSDSGAVELFNGGSAICPDNTKFGAFKWGKLSYRTGVGFEVADPSGRYPADAAITAEVRDGRVFGRQNTWPAETTVNHQASIYALGGREAPDNIQVESRLWWRKGWQLHLHTIEAWQLSRINLGSYSLAAEAPGLLTQEGVYPFASAANRSHRIALQSIHGFSSLNVSRHGGEFGARTHLYGIHSLCLVLQTDWIEQAAVLAALSWCGKKDEVAAPWNVLSLGKGCWELEHPQEGRWIIEHPVLPQLG